MIWKYIFPTVFSVVLMTNWKKFGKKCLLFTEHVFLYYIAFSRLSAYIYIYIYI